MAEPALPLVIPNSPGAGDTLPRCCPAHPDWATLSQHLFAEFPEVSMADLVREVRRAKDAVEHVNLPEDEALQIGELIVRHQLLMRSGRIPEVARLDPERHQRASRD
jgi:hypothetical protein